MLSYCKKSPCLMGDFDRVPRYLRTSHNKGQVIALYLETIARF